MYIYYTYSLDINRQTWQLTPHEETVETVVRGSSKVHLNSLIKFLLDVFVYLRTDTFVASLNDPYTININWEVCSTHKVV